MTEKEWHEVFSGVLLGTAVGDALGLPAENLSPERIRSLWHGEWRMRLLFGCGMCSDDTEHTLMVAQTLLSHPDDAAAFQRTLGWKLRWWFAALPAGVGLATAGACLKLWIGFPAAKAGVRSAGSAPAMRSAIIGAYFAHDDKSRREFVSVSSKLTHCGREAEVAALAIAELVALTTRIQSMPEREQIFELLRDLFAEIENDSIVSRMQSSLITNMTVREFARAAGLEKGVSGYALHVVPVAIYAWLRHPIDFRSALIGALECGGDTDTVGAIVGALAGVTVGKQGIPTEWLCGIAEWPRSLKLIERITARLALQKCGQEKVGPVHYFWPGVILRNLVFLIAVVTHGLRRVAPPY